MRRRALLLAVLLSPIAAAAPPTPPIPAAVRSGAEAGDPAAQLALAEAYRTGRGIAADPDAAIRWYRRAAEQGNARAGDELGFALFARGMRREAMPYIEKAAARGEARAFYLLGTAHFNGDYATRDWPLAYAQTSRAAEAGLPAARKNLELMGRYLLPGDRARADTILATLPPVQRGAANPVPTAPRVANAEPPPAPAPAAARPRGAWRIQLGAYGSPDRARADWTRLATRVPTLAGLDQRIVSVGAIQRLQAVGLTGRRDAEGLCRRIRAAGGGCFPVAP